MRGWRNGVNEEVGGVGIYRWNAADSTEEIPTEYRRQRLFPQNFLGIFKIPNCSPTAIIYPRIFVGVFREICLPRYFIGIFRGNSEETQILVFSEFLRKFVGIFRGSHFPSELRCFLVLIGDEQKKSDNREWRWWIEGVFVSLQFKQTSLTWLKYRVILFLAQKIFVPFCFFIKSLIDFNKLFT